MKVSRAASSVLVPLFILCACPLFAQFRLDLGIDAIKASPFSPAAWQASQDGSPFAYFPFPDLSIRYEFGRDDMRFGLGLRPCLPLILPVPFGSFELDSGPFAMEALVGAGYEPPFVMSAPDCSVIVADISAWWRLSFLSLGLGLDGTYYMPSYGDAGLSYFGYVGAKLVLSF